MRILLCLLILLIFNSSVSAQYGSRHPNGHWSYPGVEVNPEGITQHLLGSDHRHEVKQSLAGLTIDQQQTLHDLIHINRKTGSVHCVPYIAPYGRSYNPQIKLKPVVNQVKPIAPVLKTVPELALLNI